MPRPRKTEPDPIESHRWDDLGFAPEPEPPSPSEPPAEIVPAVVSVGHHTAPASAPRHLTRTYWVNKRAMRVHADVPEGGDVDKAFGESLEKMARAKFGDGSLKPQSDRRRYEWKR